MSKIGVIGAGAWGTALAQTYAASGHDVTLWTRQESQAMLMNQTRENALHLPGISLDQRLTITHDLEQTAAAGIILNVTPAQHLRENLRSLAPLFTAPKPIVICAKGIETISHKLMSEILAEEIPLARPAILTGPNFAADIARGLPSASTLAADEATGKLLQDSLVAKNLRLYLTPDLIGAQVAGAIKNVIAIACGICEGLKLGESARAALVTRGLAEIARLTTTLGGERETLMGQCGMGDLMLTCSSMKSRNFSLGTELASGKTLEDILACRTGVTEGVATAKAALLLAKDKGIDMPIVSIINACLYENLSVLQAVTELLNRPSKYESH